MNSSHKASLRKVAGLVLPAIYFCIPGSVEAGATFKVDDTKWVSIGAGLKTSFSAVEDRAGANGDKWATDFNLNNMRLYLNGQIHEYIKLTFNTDCQNCSNGGTMRVLDAIAKFEYNQYVNAWFGRTLIPAERRELDGPFYNPFFDTFGKSPFNPADFGLQGLTNNQSDVTPGGAAGTFGRDDGVVLWGALTADKRLTYAISAFDGLDGGANRDSNLMYVGRVSYNFWNVEDNPGYYTSSTYYGTAGDVLTVAASNIYHEDGVGVATNSGDFRGTEVDVIMEKVLPNDGVVTFNGEWKNYGIKRLAQSAYTTPNCFCMFEGNSYEAGLLYLMPDKVWIGQFQPYVRWNHVLPENSSDRNEFETGVNYVIDGHNARVSLIYQYGDIATKGIFNYGPNVTGAHVSAVKLGIQLQL